MTRRDTPEYAVLTGLVLVSDASIADLHTQVRHLIKNQETLMEQIDTLAGEVRQVVTDVAAVLAYVSQREQLSPESTQALADATSALEATDQQLKAALPQAPDPTPAPTGGDTPPVVTPPTGGGDTTGGGDVPPAEPTA